MIHLPHALQEDKNDLCVLEKNGDYFASDLEHFILCIKHFEYQKYSYEPICPKCRKSVPSAIQYSIRNGII